MAGIIKGGMGYGYVPPVQEQPVMKTIYGNKLVQQNEEQLRQAEEKKAEEVQKAAETAEKETEPEEPVEQIEYIREEDAKIERAQLIAEYEQLRMKYEKQSEEYVLRAKEKAAEIYEKTKEKAHEIVEMARTEGDGIKKMAHEEGARRGYDDGYRQGYDEGYVNALKKCRETLMELKSTAEAVDAKKGEIFLEYEHALFDTIFEIAQKITLDSLKQKDKAVITKMLREAGKRFRNSKNVKITLSKLDISERAQIDEELLHDIFRNTQNIEVELNPEAPSGTLIIDNGVEITDAGVKTQLKMIEQLGKGKYRDKTPAEMLQDRRKAKKETAEPAMDVADIIADVKKKTARRKKADPVETPAEESTDSSGNGEE